MLPLLSCGQINQNLKGTVSCSHAIIISTSHSCFYFVATSWLSLLFCFLSINRENSVRKKWLVANNKTVNVVAVNNCNEYFLVQLIKSNRIIQCVRDVHLRYFSFNRKPQPTSTICGLQRIRYHNQLLYAILKEKGLLKYNWRSIAIHRTTYRHSRRSKSHSLNRYSIILSVWSREKPSVNRSTY